MFTSLEKIYFKCPVPVQNFLVSLYGRKLYRERYAGNHDRYLKELLASQWLGPAELDELVRKKFLSLWREARWKVPHYRELVRQEGIRAEGIRGVEDLDKIPVLSKEQVRVNPERFVSEDFKISRLIRIHTSGTTGKTLRIYVDRDSRRLAYAFFSRLKIWAGLEPRKANATFAGRTIVPPDAQAPPFWRKNRKMNNVLYSSYHLSPKNLAHYVAELQRLKPHFIDSYPSSLYTLAKYMQENGLNGIFPRAIIVSSETLFPYQRETMARVFRCPIYDQYGSAEQVAFISQCERGTYHIHPEFGYVEFLRDDGTKAAPGEPGRIVCTGFTNRAMPLIRYDTGDTGVAGERGCPCGRHFPVVKEIVGRTDDILIAPDGRRVGRLDPIFKGLQSIQEAQIIQEGLNRLTLRFVPGKSFQEKEAEVLIWELKKRLGKGLEIHLQRVPEIPRSAGGKFRAVVNRIPPGEIPSPSGGAEGG